MTFRLAAAVALARLLVKPALARARDPLRARRQFERLARLLPPPPFLLCLPDRAGMYRITAGPVAEHGCLLWFHGGAYVTGSPETHSAMLGRLSRLSRLAVYAPDYPLAPLYPAPAAFDAAVAAHASLLAQGWRPDQILLGGDSAGGGLALALLSQLCRTGLRPAGAVLFSPWTDLTLAGMSLHSAAKADPILPVSRLQETVALVRGALAPEDPRLSPLFADFPAPPPVLLQLGSDEILRDDSRRIAARLQAAGGQVTLQEWPGAPHVWQLLDGLVPEARAALRQAAGFCRAQAGAPAIKR